MENKINYKGIELELCYFEFSLKGVIHQDIEIVYPKQPLHIQMLHNSVVFAF